MTANTTLQWLLDSDLSIQYQVYRDLLNTNRPDIKERISKEGWGAKYLSLRKGNGHWGLRFYQPKWTSTHYTLLDLRNLEFPTNCIPVKETLELVLKKEKGIDGGINPSRSIPVSDVCLNGMALSYFAYFGVSEKELESIIDFLIGQQMPDGGFNCFSNRVGARHSSLHTSLSVLEGIFEYHKNGYTYRLPELLEAEKDSREFVLQHRFFKSDKTGEIINKGMLNFTFPSRWRYDILRALDYFQQAGVAYDPRMADAIDVLLKKQKKNGTWHLQAYHPGQMHFEMETVGQPSRWNTLRALRVLQKYNS